MDTNELEKLNFYGEPRATNKIEKMPPYSERLLDVFVTQLCSLSSALERSSRSTSAEHLWPLQCATMNGAHRQGRSSCTQKSESLYIRATILIPLKSLNKLRRSNCSNLQFVRSLSAAGQTSVRLHLKDRPQSFSIATLYQSKERSF